MKRRLEAARQSDFSDHPWLGGKQTCRGCAYNLSGLEEAGRCPECGRSYGGEVLIHGTRRIHGSARVALVVLSSGILIGCSFWLWPANRTMSIVIGFCAIILLVKQLHSERLRSKFRNAIGGDRRWLVDDRGIHFECSLGKTEHYAPWRDIEQVTLRHRGPRFGSPRSWTRFRILEKGRPFKKTWLIGYGLKDDLHVPDLDESEAEERLCEVMACRTDGEGP